MQTDAGAFEGLIESDGSGAFSQVEYDDAGGVILRTGDVRIGDSGGCVRIYFDNQREQVITGRRFDPMGSNVILLRPGVFYRVLTQIRITKPLPVGVRAVVNLGKDISDVMMVTSGPFYAGYEGEVYFTILPYRKIEVERMTSLGTLMLFDDRISEADAEALWKVESPKTTRKVSGEKANKRPVETATETE